MRKAASDCTGLLVRLRWLGCCDGSQCWVEGTRRPVPTLVLMWLGCSDGSYCLAEGTSRPVLYQLQPSTASCPFTACAQTHVCKPKVPATAKAAVQPPVCCCRPCTIYTAYATASWTLTQAMSKCLWTKACACNCSSMDFLSHQVRADGACVASVACSALHAACTCSCDAVHAASRSEGWLSCVQMAVRRSTPLLGLRQP